MFLGSEEGCIDFLRESSLWFLCWAAAAHWGTWDFGVKRKRRVSRAPLTRKGAWRPIVQQVLKPWFWCRRWDVRDHSFTCLNSLLNFDVNAIFGEAPKTENTAYTIMSDRCIQSCLHLSLCWVILHLLWKGSSITWWFVKDIHKKDYYNCINIMI